VPLIRCHKIARGHRPLVWHGEYSFQPLDFGDGPFGIHIPNIYQNSAEVK
jgi:hypothetical protein